MNIRDFFSDAYLQPADLNPHADTSRKVVRVVQGEDGPRRFAVLCFSEGKPLALTRKQAGQLAEAWGTDVEHWADKELVMYQAAAGTDLVILFRSATGGYRWGR